MSFKNVLILIACILGCILLGSFPSLLSISSLKDWYPVLNKPSWQPPSYLFGPVWTILFTLMGMALYLIIKSDSIYKKQALSFFVVQFGLNMLWTVLFFYLKSPGMALVEIFVLLIFIIITMFQFKKINAVASYLLLPYVAWVSFATVLNATIWYLNK